LVISAVVVVVAALIWNHPEAANVAASASDPPLVAQRLYVAGMGDWEQRTPASLNRAVGEFRAAIGLYPRYAQAYAGLADCYDLLREYTLMPATQSYALAKAAAEHALALDERVAGAHAALAFADYFGYWDAAGARTHFQRALALEPDNETTRHWYATFLLSMGDFAGAMKQIDAAHALNPASLSIRADRDVILESFKQAAGVADLERLEREHPKFLSPHVYLAEHDERTGDDREFLREESMAAQLTSNASRQAVLVAARRGLATGGHRGMLRAMLEEQTKLFEAGTGDALDLARLAALSLAVDRGEADFSEKSGGGPFAFLAGDPAYQRLVARLRAGG
jgi:tetratricopeptide (TPR) repeat protein